MPTRNEWLACVALLASMPGCGGGGSGGDSGSVAEVTYSVGGRVAGLTGSGLTLQLNGANDLQITGSGSFKFPTRLARGRDFAVTVKSQTGTYRELCAVRNPATGSNLQADVTTVVVTCIVASGFLYAGGDDDQLRMHRILPSGTLWPAIPVATIASGSGWDAVGSPDGKYLYVRHYSPARVDAFAIDRSSGALAPLGSVNASNTTAAAVDLVVAPSGRFLYVSNALSLEVVRVAVNAATGALSSPGPVASLAGASTDAPKLGITPNGAFLYVLTGGNFRTGAPSRLTVYAVDATTGALAPGPTISTAPSDMLSVDPLGRFLYLQGSLNVAPFDWPPRKVYPYAINPRTGAVTAVGSGLGLSSGRGWVIDPTGRYAYFRSALSAGADFSHLHTFLLDQATGAISLEALYPVKVPGSFPVATPGAGGPGFTLDATGSVLLLLNRIPATQFQPSDLPGGSAMAIERVRPLGVGVGPGVGGEKNVVVAVP